MPGADEHLQARLTSAEAEIARLEAIIAALHVPSNRLRWLREVGFVLHSVMLIVSWPVRAAAFHKNGRPRKLVRRLLYHRDGRPQWAFERWLPTLATWLDADQVEPDYPGLGGLSDLNDRPTILVICHEASRTGAPILGWNLIRILSSRYQVVAVLLKGGPLEIEFRAIAAATVTLRPEYWNIAKVAERLVAAYRPLFAIANSIEAHAVTKELAQAGVPVIALVHEFASNTRPLYKIDDVCDWASAIIFPAEIVSRSSFDAVPRLRDRSGVYVLAQGRSQLPPARAEKDARPDRPWHEGGGGRPFVVLGVGLVSLRKGVDLFIAAAAATRRRRPDVEFLFVWVGAGYDPENDFGYSVYLADQIERSGLRGIVRMMDEVEDLEPVYRRADCFLLSSRLDPQPNVAIDAIVKGIPIVCFEGASGTAAVLSSDPRTRHLVVPYIDIEAAAEAIGTLADRRHDRRELSAALADLGQRTFDMASYTDRIDQLGREASRRSDLERIVSAAVIDSSFVPAGTTVPARQLVLAQRWRLEWSLWNGLTRLDGKPYLRRPCPGFHPQIYALAHSAACIADRRDPLAHWLENGRPSGPWSRQVFQPSYAPEQRTGDPRLALHCHFHFPDLAADFVRRLQRNRAEADLYLTTDTSEKAEALRLAFSGHAGKVRVDIVPNRGRDIGPFLTTLADDILNGGYDVFGHLHGKKSLFAHAGTGERWRNFLWENLIGGEYAMLDVALAAFAARPSLGLLIAEDPHLTGWDDNRAIAEPLAARMGVAVPLPNFFDFPVGTMFLARPSALKPLVELGLTFDDYPVEPVPIDGTILHALERLIPFAAAKAGFETGGLHVPGSNW